MKKKIISLVLVLALIFSVKISSYQDVKAADENEISFTVNYKQSDARKMAEMLNDFRASNGVYEDSQTPLVYDYDLEKVAMQRAAEIAVKFDKNHIRPDGQDYKESLADYGYDISPRNIMYGENILFGTEDSMELSDAFTALCSDDENRMVMLGYFTAVGIGHIKIEEKTDFWVQVFSDEIRNTEYVAPLDGKGTATIKVSPSIVTSLTVEYTSGNTSVAAGSTVSAPVYTAKAKFSGSELEKELVLDPIVFESDDGYVKASGGNITGLKQGTGTITAKLLGRTFSYNITVTAGSGKPVNTPTPTPEVTPTPTPTGTEKEPTKTPTATPTPTKESLKKGTGFSTGGYEYKVVSKGKVEVMGLSKEKTSKVTIANTVKYNNYTYKITKIADEAFKGNTNITSVTIGKNVTSIGKSAFAGCKNLSDLTINGTGIKKIGSKAFSKTGSKIKVKVPAKSKTNYKKLLKSAGISKKADIS